MYVKLDDDLVSFPAQKPFDMWRTMSLTPVFLPVAHIDVAR
jgi:hypothetical protein